MGGLRDCQRPISDIPVTDLRHQKQSSYSSESPRPLQPNMVLADVLFHPSEFDGATILAPWTPHVGDQFEVLHTSLFGNFFLVDRLGGVSLLDSWSGQILGVSPSYDSYKASVGRDAEFFRSWFLTDLAGLLATSGLNRLPGQVYAPFVSPALGGKLAASNFSLAPLRAYVAASAAEVMARPKT